MTMAKILVIDDERSIRNSMKDILSFEGHEVVLAENGMEGLVSVKTEKPEVVFCDIKMPKMEGIEVLERIKEFTSDVPVIMISGHGTIDTAIEAIKKYNSDWYSDHIVMYYDISAKGRAKVTEWEKKRDNFIETHSIHQRSSAYIGCPECGSKLYLGYIKGEKCPLCNTDLRPKSTIEKIKWYDKKTKECRNKNKEKCWLAKIEWHS